MTVGWQRTKNVVRNIGLSVLVLAFLSGPAAVPVAHGMSPTPFVKTAGTDFTIDGKPFFVTGVNNHYLPYGSPDEVVRVLDDAVAMGANVVRTFLQPVIGSIDGSTPSIWNWKFEGDTSDLAVRGTYLLYWDPRKNRMAINDGANGMEKIDFLIAEAGKRHLKLIIAFLDFWAYTGGAQQMRAWYGSQDKSQFFFEDPRTKQDYRDWIKHVVQRVNPLTGLAYRDDPTIMAWELMNEGNAQTEALRLAWTAEMSAYVKALDPNHLLSSGHANVYEKLSDLTIPSLDFGTWHGYPLFYTLSVQQFDDMITDFCLKAAHLNKPVLLEEFGYARSNRDAAEAYEKWLDTLVRDRNCAGWVVWRLVSKQDSGRYPLDENEQFDIRNNGSAIWNVFKAATGNAVRLTESGRVSEATRRAP